LGRHSHILQRQPDIGRHRPLILPLAPGLVTRHDLTQVRKGIGSGLKVADTFEILVLRMIVDAELVELRQRTGRPVAVQVYLCCPFLSKLSKAINPRAH
jgi:hypothetical protein